jgi:hypothetical protein
MAYASTPEGDLAIGKPLPQLRGELLTGQSAVLPDAASGRVTLLILGFTYDSRFAVEEWAKKFREEFESDPRVTFYEIPMIGGMARLGKWFITSGMRRGTPQADHGRVLTVYGGAGRWKERVGFREPDAAYLILIDQSGEVVWQYARAFDIEGHRSLVSRVSRLLDGE